LYSENHTKHTNALSGKNAKYVSVTVSGSSYHCVLGSRDSSVGIATGYGLDNRGVGGLELRVAEGARIFFMSRPVLWGPPSLLSCGYQGCFPGGKAAVA
jgi:hypothetical protein